MKDATKPPVVRWMHIVYRSKDYFEDLGQTRFCSETTRMKTERELER